MKRTVLTFGALAGGIIILYSVILFAVMGDFSNITPEKLETVEMVGYIRYLLLLLGVVLAMLSFRRNTDGAIPYRRMLQLGIGVAALTAVFVAVLEAGYVAANPGFYEQYSRLAEESMRAEGKTQADIVAMKQHQETWSFMKSPAAMGAFYFIETFLIGSLFAAVAAIFLRRQEEPGGSHTALAGEVR